MFIASLFQKTLSTEKIAKVVSVCQKLEINPNWLMAVMYFETAKTFSPSKTNSIGSVGLIQFTRDKAGVNYKTINGKKYYLSDIAKMSFFEQMDLVYYYYLPYKGKISNFIDCYLVTFFPTALGKSDSYVLQTKNLSASLIAKQNPFFNINHDAQITLGEIKDKFQSFYGKTNFKDIDTKKKISIVGLIIFLIIGYLLIKKTK